ncbi:MAG: aspartate 1-decarboxylase [Shewanella sp.]|jgi:aspartate 1-decarboxylase
MLAAKKCNPSDKIIMLNECYVKNTSRGRHMSPKVLLLADTKSSIKDGNKLDDRTFIDDKMSTNFIFRTGYR